MRHLKMARLVKEQLRIATLGKVRQRGSEAFGRATLDGDLEGRVEGKRQDLNSSAGSRRWRDGAVDA